MLLTKDNLIKFVREKKAVIPSEVSEKFNTTTMIASAALSELVKDKIINISHLKFGSTPFYYDPKQKSILIELAEKHLSENEKITFRLLKEKEILNYNSLSIQERLVLERLQDFSKFLEFELNGKNYKFYVWFMRDLDKTKKLLIDAIKNLNKEKKEETKSKNRNLNDLKSVKNDVKENVENKIESKEDFNVEEFLRKKNFTINSKTKNDKYIYYNLEQNIFGFNIIFEAYQFNKKITEIELIEIYAKNNLPKIIFVKGSSKKIKKLSEKLNNLFIVDL